MATSETRDGPGWWMGSDGGWNPPEMWPESTPPLPGWIRQPDGSWKAPVEQPPEAESAKLDLTEAKTESGVIDLTAAAAVDVPSSGATIVRGGKSVELPTVKEVPTLQPAPRLSTTPTQKEPPPSSDSQRPKLGFAPQTASRTVPPATGTGRPERDPRVLAVWITVAILACIAGLLAVLVLL